MGQDKLIMDIGGTRLIDKVISEARSWSRFIILAGKGYSGLPSDITVVPDKNRGKGPLMGIHSGLSASNTQLNFIVAGDIPQIHPGLITRLLSFTQSNDIVIPSFEVGYLEPLMGFYNKSVLDKVERLLLLKKCKISNLFDLCPTHIEFFNDKSWYHNLNTPKDVSSFSDQVGDVHV